MSPESVSLWIQRAESDLKTGLDEFKSEKPAVVTICYLMQQAAEKYLKAEKTIILPFLFLLLFSRQQDQGNVIKEQAEKEALDSILAH
jgi:hypothetical protein